MVKVSSLTHILASHFINNIIFFPPKPVKHKLCPATCTKLNLNLNIDSCLFQYALSLIYLNSIMNLRRELFLKGDCIS